MLVDAPTPVAGGTRCDEVLTLVNSDRDTGVVL